MPQATDLRTQARAKRDAAARARQLARGLTSEADRVLLLQYADELEGQANELERQADTMQQQQQQQKEPGSEPDAADPTESKQKS